MINMMGQSGAGRGGSRRAMFARSARSSSAAVDAALLALAAVNGQGAAAMLAIREGKRDPAFRQKVRVTRAKPPTLSADSVLNAGSAAALNKLLVAEAEAYALIAAMATALWRARAAHAKKNSRRRQPAAGVRDVRRSGGHGAQAHPGAAHGSRQGSEGRQGPRGMGVRPGRQCVHRRGEVRRHPGVAPRADGQARGRQRRPQAAARGRPRPGWRTRPSGPP